MSQSRKKKVLEEARKHRQRRALVTVLLVVGLIAIIAGGVYAFLINNKPVNWRYQCLGQEALTFHIHPWLRIWINNANITIPAAIGIQNPTFQKGIAVGGSCFEPLHTDDSSGIIHIESPDTSIQYTLDDLFQIWKLTYSRIPINGASQPVIFNSTDIFGYKTDQTHRLVLLVDGTSSTAYGSLVLNQYDYCDHTIASVAPCYPTAGGDPYYNGQSYPYGTKYTIVIAYMATTS